MLDRGGVPSAGMCRKKCLREVSFPSFLCIFRRILSSSVYFNGLWF
nr:MAG TPA: hypothetical protein [Caudoviricetes sp.]DAX72165.1 MAG TPA: hypothetical protein [Caudoviricetes sp.]